MMLTKQGPLDYNITFLCVGGVPSIRVTNPSLTIIVFEGPYLDFLRWVNTDESFIERNMVSIYSKLMDTIP